MFCNFCGKNFDTSEGFEEISRNGHHMTRCEKCVYENREEEYDWSVTMFGRFQNQHGGRTAPSSKSSES